MPEPSLERFLFINVSNLLFRQSACVLYGELRLPVEEEAYSIRKEMYHAGFGTSKLVAALNLAFKKLEVLTERPGLFEYFMKLNRFTYHGLSQVDGYAAIGKERIYEELELRHGFPLPAFAPDAGSIQRSFLAANACSARLAQRLYSPQKSRVRNETLLKILECIDPGLGVASLDGEPVFVFKNVEPLDTGDVVPVRIVEPEEPAQQARMHRLRGSGRALPGRFKIGLRQ